MLTLTGRFAARHLGSRHGKTEAWVVLGTKGSEPSVHLGWSRDVEQAELARWVTEQDRSSMLGTLNHLGVRSGDAVVVPAGTPHAIGEGVFCVELQEPTDFSVMLELKGFDLDPAGGELGLGRELALSCVRRGALTTRDLESLRRTRGTPGAIAGPAVEDVFRRRRARTSAHSGCVEAQASNWRPRSPWSSSSAAAAK